MYAIRSYYAYRYKLEGFDTDWKSADANKRMAIYTNIDPGKYQFRLQAYNNDNVKCKEDVLVSVRILPPFWMRGWFHGLLTSRITSYNVCYTKLLRPVSFG